MKLDCYSTILFTNIASCCVEFWAGSEWSIFFDQDIEKNFSKKHLCKTKWESSKWTVFKSMDLFGLKYWTKCLWKVLLYVVEFFCQLILISSDYKMFQSWSLGIWLSDIISSLWIKTFNCFKTELSTPSCSTAWMAFVMMKIMRSSEMGIIFTFIL